MESKDEKKDKRKKQCQPLCLCVNEEPRLLFPRIQLSCCVYPTP
jgi:hypothetical protein